MQFELLPRRCNIKLQNWRKLIENHLPSTIYYTLHKGQILNETWDLQKLELHPLTQSWRAMLHSVTIYSCDNPGWLLVNLDPVDTVTASLLICPHLSGDPELALTSHHH